MTSHNNISNSNDDLNYHKFSIEVIPKNKKGININIDLGFNIVCVEESNSDFSLDKDSSESSEDMIISSQINQEYSIFRKFNIFKEINVSVLLDISNGKLIFVNNKDNINIKDNNFTFEEKKDILSSCDCKKFPLDKIKEVKPIYKYNPEDLKIIDIIFNGEQIHI